MIKITEADIEKARKLIAKGTPTPIGYRLLVKPLDSIEGMETAMQEAMPTLAKSGFITKTEDQKERESKGTHHGLLVSVGPVSFNGAPVPEEGSPSVGDVVIFDRYAGFMMELPPGSGDNYRFMNDESILGKMVATDE